MILQHRYQTISEILKVTISNNQLEKEDVVKFFLLLIRSPKKKKKGCNQETFRGQNSQNFSSLYIREIYIMAKMNSLSPYFLPLAGYTVEPPYCIITDYMQKGSLHKYYQLNTANPIFNGTHSQIIAIQILLGINSMHSRGFIHRDLKLGNILLEQDNTPKIADLGLSRMKTSNNLMTCKIRTLHTMAPEVYNGQPYTYSADVYSFGVILYSMNERRSPTQNMTKNQLKNGTLFKAPSFRYTPQPMRNLIDSCIKYNPEEVRRKFGLNDENLGQICVSLLLRLKTIPFSKELYTNILNKAKSDKKCITVLFKFSESSKENLNLFVDDLNWLLFDLPTVDDTFRLFLSIFRNNEYRDKIGLSDQFVNFLICIVKSGNTFNICVVPSILGRFNMTKESAEKLQKNGFFRIYYESAIAMNDPEVNMKAAILLDQTCRIFFADDLLLFLPRLREMASIRDQADVAINVATSLSYFQPFRESLVRCGFVQAFQYLRNSQVYKDKAAMFLRNVGCQ